MQLQRAVSVVAAVAAAGSVLTAQAHPTKYDIVAEYVPGGPLPPFRSFHVHVLFQREHYSDTCTGYDQALDFRNRFMEHFGLDSTFCTGDFDQGRLCMFPTALTPFGPFPVPQWAAFIPYEDFAKVVPWVMQNKGPFDVFVHPNTGYERYDHHDWGIWAGRQWPLDVTAAEFSKTLPDLYNTSCRDVAPRRKIPRTGVPTLNPSSAHIRFFNFDTKTAQFTSSSLGFQVPSLAPVANTWYFDTSAGHQVVNVEGTSKSYQFLANPGSFYTFVNLGGSLFLLKDDNEQSDEVGKMRFVNLLDGVKIDVKRDGKLVFAGLDHVSLEVRRTYDEVAEAQYFYTFYNAVTGELIATEPIYVSASNSNTLFITGFTSKSDPTGGLVLFQDYPQDVPAMVAPFDPVNPQL